MPGSAIVGIKASLADAELQIGDEQPHPASELTKYRVEPGKVTVHVHKTHFQPYEKTLTSWRGKSRASVSTWSRSPRRHQ